MHVISSNGSLWTTPPQQLLSSLSSVIFFFLFSFSFFFLSLSLSIFLFNVT